MTVGFFLSPSAFFPDPCSNECVLIITSCVMVGTVHIYQHKHTYTYTSMLVRCAVLLASSHPPVFFFLFVLHTQEAMSARLSSCIDDKACAYILQMYTRRRGFKSTERLNKINRRRQEGTKREERRDKRNIQEMHVYTHIHTHTQRTKRREKNDEERDE